MDFGDMLEKQQAVSEHVQKMNLQFATMETDFTNPMVFDIKGMKQQELQMKENMGEVDWKKWRSIYPCYFDKNLTIAEGRRLGKESAIENPNIHLLSFALSLLKVKHVQQLAGKHPRDFMGAGRLKVQICNENGDPINPEIANKKELFRKMSLIWPQAQAEYEKRLTAQHEANDAKKAQMEAM